MAMLGVIFSAICLWQLRCAADRGAVGFSNSLLVDPFFLFFGSIFLIATALVIMLSVRYLQLEDENHGEYYALMLFATVGMMFMASGYDLIVQFLGLETMAISFYVLAGFLRRDNRSNEGAVKYLLLGAFSSAILAYGFSILYGIGATANLSSLGQALPPRTNLDVIAVAVEARGHTDLLVLLALATVVAGLFFKVAAVPFHQWAPDVYEGAPTPITAYISVASKTASFALLLRLLLTVFWPVRVDWEMLIAGVAIASLTLGNFAAITQTNVKRMLAYSSISHVGYILLGIVAAASSPLGFLTGMKGVAFYLFVYGFMTIGAFAVLIVLQRQGIIGDELDDLNGLYRRSPLSALVLLIFMLSLAGIPPLAGFVGKYFILQALIETGHNRLALFGALYIVPALYYYFRIVAARVFVRAGQRAVADHHHRAESRLRRAVLCDGRRRRLSRAVRAPRDLFAVFPGRFQWPLRNQLRLPPHRRENGPLGSCAADIAMSLELPFLLVASVAIGGGVGYLMDTRLHTRRYLL